ncbi:hypothetical protein KUTeg_016208 [Tegillarca granosa]|uniref:SMP-30/Gluconolactonase/LRE-like region domain-containing protein n=1 Tax=Tegillarca granosa TaxID=220873 RepID=A0ABQ9EK67_TEGGR|nr:hypothetical protein KUTeg_016208 [Tegillarca granosa]
MSVKVECLLKNATTTIGESPHWDESSRCLFYVDIQSNDVHRWNSVTGKDDKIHFDGHVGFVVPCSKDGFIIGLETRLCHYDMGTKKTTFLYEVDKGTRHRFNDAKCDPKGRLWAGTIGFVHTIKVPLSVEDTGHLYSLETNGSLRKHLDDINISNGMAWTRDTKTMYYIDTIPRKVYAFDFDIEAGKISITKAESCNYDYVYIGNKKIAVDLAVKPIEEYGYPDGMTIDVEDMIWVAGLCSHKIFRFNPKTGISIQHIYQCKFNFFGISKFKKVPFVLYELREEISSIKFPTPQITSCCFGGKNFDELYVTSAAETTKEGKKKYPLSGSIFKVTGLGVKGLPAPLCLKV